MIVNRPDSTPARISTNLSIERQTPKRDFGDRMKAGLQTTGGITANGIADVFQQVLDGVNDVELLLRFKGVPSQPEMAGVMSEILQLKMQLARVVLRARGPRP